MLIANSEQGKDDDDNVRLAMIVGWCVEFVSVVGCGDA
jgi:hypothetical protein